MFTRNDEQKRWVNGTIGKVVRIHGDLASTEVIEVELEKGATVEVTPFRWEMYRFFFNEGTRVIESESAGAFTQYPLRLAWAVTIHKSQGKTFTNVIIDVGSGTFAHGQIYVALSRCTTFEGIVLKRPILLRHILLDESVTTFMASHPAGCAHNGEA